MRNICALLALSLMVGCGGGDGKDGSNGAPGAQGAAGPPGANGQDGQDGDDGAPGADGTDGMDGAPGTNGADGADGTDGGAILQGSGAPAVGLGVDGDIYIDTVSRDVYQKANGTWSVITNLSGGPPGPKGDQGDPGADGADGAPGTNGSDGADGMDGTDGVDGVDVKDTLGGVRWFAFGLSAGTFMDMPSLITSETYSNVSSAAVFTFTGAGQSGRLAFKTSSSFISAGVDLQAYDAMNLSITIGGGTVTTLALYMAEGTKKGCQWNLNAAGGPSYVVNLATSSSCYNTSTGAAFSLASVTDIQIGIVSDSAGARTLTITDIDLIDNL
jgi:hypothetical protein